MISKALSFWIVLTTFGWALCETETYSPCKIQHLDGICQPITSCEFAMKILSINDVSTLRSMFCGFEGSLPKVCCPIVNRFDKSTTTRRILTTTAKYEDNVDENEVVTRSPLSTSPEPAPANKNVLPSRDVCGQITDEDRIYGGEIARIDEFPWLARIKFYNPSTRKEMYACGGSLISDRYVLTAAHCLTVYKPVSVRLGEWDTDTDIDCQDGYCNDEPLDVNVEKSIPYPEFDRRNYTHGDVGLLRLEHPVKFTDFIRPVCLPTTEYIARQDYSDSTFTAAGWGKTEFGQPSELPRKINIDAVRYSICKAAVPALPRTQDPSVICAGGKKGRDTCQGDSGGPLLRIVTENYEQNWYLYGITSHGAQKCGSAGLPGIYTRVTKYMDWILETINKG